MCSTSKRLYEGFHSISFPNEWGEEKEALEFNQLEESKQGFHSISFPNEWGVIRRRICVSRGGQGKVSIQLVSPTSGEVSYYNRSCHRGFRVLDRRFPFN